VEVKGQIGRGRGLEIGARSSQPSGGSGADGGVGSRAAGEGERRGEARAGEAASFKLARVLVKRRH